MATDEEHVVERTPLLFQDRRLSSIAHEADAASVISSHVSKEEQVLAETAVGERLPYNDYTTIDWLHDLVSIKFVSKNISTAYHSWGKGQRLISPSFHTRRSWYSGLAGVGFRLVSGMDCRRTHRHVDSLCGFSGRYCCRYGQ